MEWDQLFCNSSSSFTSTPDPDVCREESTVLNVYEFLYIFCHIADFFTHVCMCVVSFLIFARHSSSFTLRMILLCTGHRAMLGSGLRSDTSVTSICIILHYLGTFIRYVPCFFFLLVLRVMYFLLLCIPYAKRKTY